MNEYNGTYLIFFNVFLVIFASINCIVLYSTAQLS